MAPKKASAVKKASKRAAPPVEEETNGSGGGGRRLEIDPKMAKKVAKARDEGTSWEEIAEDFDISTGKAQLLNMYARVDEDDRITGTDTQIAKQVVKQRDAGYSWGALMARTGIGEGRLRKMYEEQTGTSTKGNRIGKGGRYPGDAKPNGATPSKKAAKATKSTKKAAKAGKAQGAEKPREALDPNHPLADMSLEQLKQRLEGKTIKVTRPNSDALEPIKVGRIQKKTKDGEVTLKTQAGKSRTILATHIRSATK